ncbi:MAG: TolC family protein [Notoacmeibacter sp.]
MQKGTVAPATSAPQTKARTLIDHLKTRSTNAPSGAAALPSQVSAETAPASVSQEKTGAVKAAATPDYAESIDATTPFEPRATRFSGEKRSTLLGWLSSKGPSADQSANENIDTATKTASLETAGAAPSGKGSKASLSLAKIVGKTLETNPDILIVDAQEKDAKIAVQIEKTALLPEVDLIVQSGKENTNTESASSENVHRSEMNISVEHVLYDFGARKNAIGRREVLLDSARLRRQDKNEEISLQVIEAYLEYRRNSDLLDAAAKNMAAHQKIVQLVVLNEKGGNATVADVKRAETRFEAAKTDQLAIANRKKDAVAAFRRLTGSDPETVKSPVELAPKGKTRELKDIQKLIGANPLLRSMSADKRSLESQWQQQQSTLRPEIYLRGEANYKLNVAGDTGLASDFKGMLGMRLKLFDGGRRYRMLDQIDSRIEEADARHAKLYRELLQQMEQNNQALSTGEEKQKLLQEQMAASNQAMELYQEQFQAGERTPFEVLDAQRDTYKAQGELINHRYDAAASVYRNLRLNGGLSAVLTQTSDATSAKK